MSQLEEYSRIIQEMGERHAAEQDGRLEVMRKTMPQAKVAVQRMSNAELLDYFEVVGRHRGCYDPRERAIWNELCEFCKTQILGRLG